MVNNYICTNCDRQNVCKIMDKISAFNADGKKDLGVNIYIEACNNYKEVPEEE